MKRNSVRLAEVWLDDYAKYYYQRIGNEKGNYGDITERVRLRLVCRCAHHLTKPDYFNGISSEQKRPGLQIVQMVSGHRLSGTVYSRRGRRFGRGNVHWFIGDRFNLNDPVPQLFNNYHKFFPTKSTSRSATQCCWRSPYICRNL